MAHPSRRSAHNAGRRRWRFGIKGRLPSRHGRCALKRAFALGLLTALLLTAADAPKPKVRAITAFITIDAKSYPVQIAEAVKFLSQMRDAVKAAGYDVAG